MLTYISREVLLRYRVLPVIRGFKKLSFLMTGKTVRKTYLENFIQN